ncbi:hypothetical protein Cfor_05794, partial [Coptotermes formosanus]
ELLLVECRQPPLKEPLTADSIRGPSAEEIRVVTKNVAEKNTLKLHPLEFAADFQSEIRKILISMVEASARIITPCPDADEVSEVIQERLHARTKSEPDLRAVSQLMDMGFSEHVASRALHLNRMNPSEALEWLLENRVDEESEDAKELKQEAASGCLRRQQEAVASGTSDHNKVKSASLIQLVATLLDSLRISKRRDFKPDTKALQNLMDMGFPEEDICDALHVTGNNQSAACEWLLGDRHPSLEDMDTGLDPDGPMYNAIMSNPAIRLSLSSPKMLLGAFVQDKYKNLGRVSCFCTVLSETPTMLVQQQ